jgi:LmbE family N-acetylglucosaminyl deacetylase
MKLLVIAPHCDDAEFGCGGYIARHGKDAMIVTVGASDLKLVGAYETTTGAQRLEEQKAAVEVLGCRWAMDEIPGLFENNYPPMFNSILGLIEDMIDAYRPQELLFPLPSFNQDHETVYRACITALRPTMPRPYLKKTMAYEYPMNCWGPQVPDLGKVYVPLTYGEFHQKLEALNCHKSQVGDREHSIAGSMGVANLAVMRGLECGERWAELFYLHKEVL